MDRGKGQRDKAGWGGPFAAALPWDEFDALPWEIRRLYCFCAYDYTPIGAWRRWVRGESLESIERKTRAAMRRAVRSEAFRVYGPTHPQAAA